MSSLSIFFGGMAVLALFVGQIMLMGSLFDKWNARARAIEAAKPGQAKLKAERLVRRLGKGILQVIRAATYPSGLLVLPGSILIVHDGAWVMLPALFALTFVTSVVEAWTSRNLDALDSL